MKNFVFFTFLSLLSSFLLYLNHPLSKDFSESKLVLSPKKEDKLSKINSDEQNLYIQKKESPSHHSSSIADTKKGKILLFFSGTREGASDVAIYRVFLEEKDLEPVKILDPSLLSNMSKKFIKKLTNPVVFTDLNGKTHLFVVGVSLGGWSSSKIYHLSFDEDLQNLKYEKELRLSFFANLSHLVRNQPLLMQDKNSKQSGFILPIYHELARKYTLLAYFDENAKLLYTKKINFLKNQLQPSMSTLNEKEFLLSFRNHKAYENALFLQRCSINSSCKKPFKTELKNYDSANLLFSFYENELLHNFLIQNKDDEKNPRKELLIYKINDEKICELLSIDSSREISYPSMLIKDSKLYISYTYDREKIGLKTLSLDELKDKTCL